MSNLLEAREVHRSFLIGNKQLDVLRGVSLVIQEGDTLAVTGMSGAGKSTLLHVLGGLDQPTSGQVWFRGRDLYAARDRERSAIRARKIGFVFQAYHLLPELTVQENVVLPALSRSMAFLYGKNLRERAAELLAQVGLADRSGHRPNELSGGEQQRVALARALMNEPELVLADEPTGNLDSRTGEEVLRYLFDLVAEQHLTLVMVTHNESVAARCSRHVELRDGLPVPAVD
ncbi:MAG: ABC transporter ATP-binding protein [Verrucomicrobiota bacterium]|jgi:ABC-type lipoprotein export system ATPase subunit|nr:ABC transporter ATP-binding protein [Verrucomicrobiota bacterium]